MNVKTEMMIRDLGEVVKAQLELMRTGNMSDPETLKALKAQGMKGMQLEKDLVERLGILDADEKSSIEILKEIVAIAEQDLSNAAEGIKSLLPVLEQINDATPKGSCPTPQGLHDAANDAYKGDKGSETKSKKGQNRDKKNGAGSPSPSP